MKRTILAERFAGQTRVAVLEDGALAELETFRPGGEPVAGSIYLGRVDNLAPGLNAAFVDIGAEKKAFYSADDVLTADGSPARIADLARAGQERIVQVVRDPGGDKGVRVSGDVSLTGRLCVLHPLGGNVGVSKKITLPDERSRLKAIALGLSGREGMGVVIRTEAKGADAAQIQADFDALRDQWREISRRAEYEQPPRLLFDAGDPCLMIARELMTGSDAEVLTDDSELLERIQAFVLLSSPERVGRVRRFEGAGSVFDAFRVDAQATRGYRHKVWLDSGGYLVIDETEALTVIDVNSGKADARGDQEAFLRSLNVEAAKMAARILRLRDIGGIVIIDFVDMREESNRQAVLSALKEAASTDRCRVRVLGFTQLGLAELTRQKSRRPWSRRTLRACPVCGGTGSVPDGEAVAYAIAREACVRSRGAARSALRVETTQGAIRALRNMRALPGEVELYARTCPNLPEEGYRFVPHAGDPNDSWTRISDADGENADIRGSGPKL